jgi:hypothetical protein
MTSTLIGYDYSGSTGNRPFYHTKTQDIVSRFPDKTIASWDDRCEIISTDRLQFINRNLTGRGGTSPICLVDYIIKNDFHGHLVLITDGDIYSYEVKRCSDKLIEWKFEKVTVYLIYTTNNVNESISCAFTRNSPHHIEMYNYSNTLESSVTISDEDFEYVNAISEINTIDEFLSKVDIFDNVLMSVNMGTTGNSVIHKNLVQLKNRLIKNSSNVKNINEIDKLNEELIVDNLKNVWNLYYTGSNDWSKQIDKYISWCSGGLVNTFDRRSNREINHVVTPIVAPETVSTENTTNLSSEPFSIECPIMLEKSTNIIILFNKIFESLFDTVPDNVRESLINCPLNALKNDDAITFLKKTLGHAISIEAYKELVEHGISDKSPLTRDDIMGGLCLGADFSHVKATNSTIRHGLLGGKSLGNVDLWYAVFYLMVESGYVEHLKEYLPAMREHMIFRLNTSKTYMCLTGLPTFPTYKVPLKTALWSVISATAIPNIQPKNDPLRFHLSYSEYIIELAEMTELRFPSGINNHINCLKTLRFFLNKIKKNDTTYINLVDVLKYNAFETPDLWIMIDGKPSPEQLDCVRSKLPEYCKYLSTSEIIYILNLCENNKNRIESDINIPFNHKYDKYEIKTTKNWDYDENIPYHKVEISLKSCRPFYKVDKDKIWVDVATKVYGKKFISIDSRFGDYVVKYEKYPTKNEFLVYLYNYYSNRGKTTLPICIRQFVDEVLEDHNYIIENLSVSEYIKRWKYSNSIKNRIDIEYN